MAFTGTVRMKYGLENDWNVAPKNRNITNGVHAENQPDANSGMKPHRPFSPRLCSSVTNVMAENRLESLI